MEAKLVNISAKMSCQLKYLIQGVVCINTKKRPDAAKSWPGRVSALRWTAGKPAIRFEQQ